MRLFIVIVMLVVNFIFAVTIVHQLLNHATSVSHGNLAFDYEAHLPIYYDMALFGIILLALNSISLIVVGIMRVNALNAEAKVLDNSDK